MGDFICHLRDCEELHLISKMFCLIGLSNYILLYEHLEHIDHITNMYAFDSYKNSMRQVSCRTHSLSKLLTAQTGKWCCRDLNPESLTLETVFLGLPFFCLSFLIEVLKSTIFFNLKYLCFPEGHYGWLSPRAT